MFWKKNLPTPQVKVDGDNVTFLSSGSKPGEIDPRISLLPSESSFPSEEKPVQVLAKIPKHSWGM